MTKNNFENTKRTQFMGIFITPAKPYMEQISNYGFLIYKSYKRYRIFVCINRIARNQLSVEYIFKSFLSFKVNIKLVRFHSTFTANNFEKCRLRTLRLKKSLNSNVNVLAFIFATVKKALASLVFKIKNVFLKQQNSILPLNALALKRLPLLLI